MELIEFIAHGVVLIAAVAIGGVATGVVILGPICLLAEILDK